MRHGFCLFFDNSNEMVKQSSCSCDLKNGKCQMSDVRCQERARREKRGEKGGSSMTDLLAIISTENDHPNH